MRAAPRHVTSYRNTRGGKSPLINTAVYRDGPKTSCDVAGHTSTAPGPRPAVVHQTVRVVLEAFAIVLHLSIMNARTCNARTCSTHSSTNTMKKARLISPQENKKFASRYRCHAEVSVKCRMDPLPSKNPGWVSRASRASIDNSTLG